MKSAASSYDTFEKSTSRNSWESKEIPFPPLSTDPTGEEDSINMAHLELFNHLVNGDWEIFGIGRSTFIPIAIRNADTAPYLMYELLALSAQHLSIISPVREEYYKNQAMRLQNRSIALFNDVIVREEVTPDNCIPCFVFSSTLGTHHFCNVVRSVQSAEGDFATLIESLVNSINLYQGLRAVIDSKWSIISDSELKPILKAGTDALLGFLENDNYKPKETQSKRLMLLLDEPLDQLHPTTVEAYHHAINLFDCLLHYRRTTPDDDNELRGIFGWPALVSKEFKDELARLSPKALIILAHFAVLLYYQRQLWLLSDGGGCLIRCISQNLDAYWLGWLQWPTREISNDTVIVDGR